MLQQRLVGVFALGAFLLAGCGSGLVETKGQVVWDDGKPVDQANVVFHPKDKEAPEASGFTDKDGNFKLMTGSEIGARRGEYAVTVVRSAGPSYQPTDGPGGEPGKQDLAQMGKMMFEKMGKTAGKVTDQTPKAYHDKATTPLNWKIEGPNTSIKLEVKKS